MKINRNGSSSVRELPTANCQLTTANNFCGGQMEMVIRRANSTDAEMLTRLAARTFYDAFASSNTPEDMQAYMSEAFNLKAIEGALTDPRAKFLIAEVGGEPAGYAKLYEGEVPECITGPDPIEIVRLYVEQRWLGSGVGRALMQTCLDEARRSGHQTIYLGVWEQNHRALAFYRKWGFEIVGSHILKVGDDTQNDWWMERRL
jgi:diamine N-acetyltransferase